MNPTQRVTLPFLLFGLTVLSGVSGLEETPSGPEVNTDEETLDQEPEFYKRLYDFGLGKRAYSYVSEYKRLPVYNFGLGKRSKMYNFGLGKRAAPSTDYEFDYNETGNDLPEEELYDDDDLQSVEKREKLYSFGLGKRSPKYDFGLGKRSPKYDFGLGKRESKFNFGLGKRERLYNFGLGKRTERMFAYGKRPQMQSRFNFGLGKRSEDEKRSPSPYSFGIGKREINPKDLEENYSAEIEGAHPVSDLENQNHTVEIDSHEIMGHSDRSHLHKRSAPLYSSLGFGKSNSPYDIDYTSHFRNAYNLGLGKRIPKYDFGLGKRNNEP